MYINNSNNNYQQSFGHFKFTDGAKNIIKKKIKTPKDLGKFERLCDLERTGGRGLREIFISASEKNGSYSGSKLTANPGNKWYKQGFFQSPLAFLEKMMKKADIVQKQTEFSTTKNTVVDRLM